MFLFTISRFKRFHSFLSDCAILLLLKLYFWVVDFEVVVKGSCEDRLHLPFLDASIISSVLSILNSLSLLQTLKVVSIFLIPANVFSGPCNDM